MANRLVHWGVIISLVHFSLTYVGILFDTSYTADLFTEWDGATPFGRVAHFLVTVLTMPLGLVWSPSLGIDLSNIATWTLIAVNSGICGFVVAALARIAMTTDFSASAEFDK